eukprot:2740081-Prymnesium_polylepis.1
MDTKRRWHETAEIVQGLCDETGYKLANINFTLHIASAQHDIVSAQHERPLYNRYTTVCDSGKIPQFVSEPLLPFRERIRSRK